jgi:hypothetical protein
MNTNPTTMTTKQDKLTALIATVRKVVNPEPDLKTIIDNLDELEESLAALEQSKSEPKNIEKELLRDAWEAARIWQIAETAEYHGCNENEKPNFEEWYRLSHPVPDPKDEQKPDHPHPDKPERGEEQKTIDEILSEVSGVITPPEK